MKALILAAGYGTRMYPLTKACPKPLLPVGARPILDYALEKLGRLKGLKEAIIVTNDKFFQNFKDWAAKSGDKHSFALKVLNDGTKSDAGRLGAIGDINFALSRENAWDDLIIFGGDNLFEDDLSAEIQSFTSGAKIFGKEVPDPERFGVAEVDPTGRVISIEEKPKMPRHKKAVPMKKYWRGYKKFPAESSLCSA